MFDNDANDLEVAPLDESPLGKKVFYIDTYNPSLLFAIPRQAKRDEIGVPLNLPFFGVDVWNAFEISWLNKKGKPLVAIAQFLFPCESPFIIESKSFKLYLNSFNQTKFEHKNEVINILQRDLSEKVNMPVNVSLQTLDEIEDIQTANYTSQCLDDLDITVDSYQVNPNYLRLGEKQVRESLHSHLLKANCLVTGQPDWASIEITYQGKNIQHDGLLQYIISFRNHNEFHEQCVERIFMDILTHCKPQELTVEARFTRRGGLDINPFRSTDKQKTPKHRRLLRQ